MLRILQKAIFVAFGFIFGLIVSSSQQSLTSLKGHEYLTASWQGQVSHGFHTIMLD